MSSSSFIAVLCLMTLASGIDARLNLDRILSDLTGSNTIKNDEVRNMALDEISKLRSPFLLQRRPMGMQTRKTAEGRLSGPFNWSSCGPADQSIDIRNLTLGPSPFHFPGELDFGFDIIFHDTISSDSPVSADLKLQVNTQGTWIDIPCIGSIGSCHYDNLCSILSKIQCPADLKQQGIPCNCPFNKGEYKLQKYSVSILASVFLSGDYKAKAVITDTTKGQIGCYQISFTVE
ncbi:ganglioside GM2 activator [Elysia marginata]|uniref:Ganglioside GM2 activator n=1 Tax=Elysia marginata TaxID=1093978 RepID=A0AAV4IHR4_9GAST|nr:ganglioside GM2 activator [Elysia marginata]